jgi:DNA polymerase-1
MKKRLFLIDAPGFYYRAFYGIKGRFSSPSGMPTNAIYGFIKMFKKILGEEKPDAVAVALDSKEKTFRHEVFAEYKANRQAMPEELSVQLPFIEKVIEAFHIPILKENRLEADDLLGYAAIKGVAEGYDVVLVSGDKDLMQLVGGGVTLFDPLKEKYIDSEGVKEKFGVEPGRVVEMLGLMGDQSDNIPGVPGVGPKTALKLLEEYGDIEGIIANAEKITKPKLRQSIIENAGKARLSRELATIKTDLDVELDIKLLKAMEPDRGELNKIYAELGFKSLKEEEPDGAPAPATVKAEGEKPAGNYKTIFSESELKELVSRLQSSGGFAVDTETTSLEPMRAKIVGMSFSFAAGEAYYIPIGHDYEGAPAQLSLETVVAAVKPLLENHVLEKYGQNIKYDLIIFRNAGVDIDPLSFDTMIASYLLYADERRHSLSFLAEKLLGTTMVEYSDVAGKGVKEIGFNKVDIEKATAYAAEDADMTFRLATILKSEIKKTGLEDLYYNLEMPIAGLLAEMEMNGIEIDEKRLADYSVELEGMMTELEKEIYGLAGEEFNIGSPKQLSVILFDKLKLKGVRKTKTGISTDQKTLEVLAGSHPLPKVLLRYRMLSKLKSTYVDPLPQLVVKETGRIHTSFNQAMAVTGRLSSNSPNLQNIPVRTEEGRKIREAFHGGEGNLLISADYSQIELRLLAHLSGDTLLVESFLRNEDIHTRTAEEIFGPIGGDAGENRRIAKAINFSIVYGTTAFGLARSVGISRGDAADYIKSYFERYRGVTEFIEKVKESAREEGLVRTMHGRIRRISDINSRNRNAREMAERMAVNTVVQGSAADLMKKAMIKVCAVLSGGGAKGLGAKTLLQVHDELILEAPSGSAGEVARLVRETMESAEELIVPLKVETSTGVNWGELH